MILEKLNGFRRKVMPRLTKNIGNAHKPVIRDDNKPPVINKILISRPNQRLGNLLLTTPLISELETVFPSSKIDIIVKGTLARIVFQEYKSIDRIIVLPKKPFKELFKYLKIFFSVKFKKYDLVINGEKDSSSGRLLTALANSPYKVYGFYNKELDDLYADYGHMSKNAIYDLRYYLNQIGFDLNRDAMPNLDLKLTKDELGQGKDILNKLISDTRKKTILIFTFATGIKCYSKEWWSEFYLKLVNKFGETYNIVEVLPLENVSQIDFKATTFYSKDIREIGALIANATLFIGADSGMMHLSSASGTDTIGLFSVTSEDKYQPYNDKSVSFNTTKHTTTELIEKAEHLLMN